MSLVVRPWHSTKALIVASGCLLSALGGITKVRGDDRAPLERIATIPSKGKAGMLDHLFVDSERARLFLANQSNDTLDIIDLRTHQLSKQILGQTTMHGVVYVPDLGRIFVGNEDKEGSCTVIDAASYAILKSIPAKGADSVHYDPQRSRIYVASEKSLTVINAKSLELVTTIRLPGSPYGFQVAKTKDRIYVNVSSPLQVAVVDAAKNEVVDHFSLEGGSKGIGPLALDEANSRILVGLRRNPRLAVLDIDSGKDTATCPIPEGADDMFLDAESKLIYVSCNSGFVAVIRQVDADHYAPIGTIQTTKGAKTSFYDPALKRLYLAVPRLSGRNGPEIWVYQARP